MHVYSSRADWQEEVEWHLAIAPIQSLEDLALNEWANPWMNPKIWSPGHVLLHNDNWPHPVVLSWFSSCFRVSWSRALSLAWTFSITCPALGCKMVLQSRKARSHNRPALSAEEPIGSGQGRGRQSRHSPQALVTTWGRLMPKHSFYFHGTNKSPW